MTDVEQLLQRQARWQRSRQALSWPEKIRMAEQVRDSITILRAGRETRTAARRSPQSQERNTTTSRSGGRTK